MDTVADSRPAGEASHRTKGLLRLTMACNERCPFCNVPAEDYPSLTPPAADTEAELQRFLDDGADTLTISGGEPTLLRKRLIPLVERARAGGILYVELQTNAVLIDGAYAQALATAGVTSAFVSFLSHVPELHDTLAGRADDAAATAWLETVSGLPLAALESAERAPMQRHEGGYYVRLSVLDRPGAAASIATPI